ncbi:MAG: BrnA antitoxin family protein [Sphaerochaetaceae bacterium]
MADKKNMTTEERITELRKRGIDFSDIPELTPEYLSTLKRVVPRDHFKVVPVKKTICIKLDADVLAHYKSKGKGYQTRINKVLRQDMLRETAPAYGKAKKSEEENT